MTSPMLLGTYKVNLYDQYGTKVAVFDDWRRLEIQHLVNDPGYCKLELEGNDARTELFEQNSIIEVLRKVPGYAPDAVPIAKQRDNDWYVEYEGLHVDITRIANSNGIETFESYSKGYLDLIARRYILWKATTGASESKKVGIPAQTAIYQFVNENCGASATVAAGRLVEGTITGLTVPAWTGAGSNWYGARAYRSLLPTIQSIADFAGIDFDVIGTGAAAWQFETYIDQLGEDRTTVGLTGGVNAEGNAPVIFSIESGNVSKVTYRDKHSGSANVVVTAGQGEYTARMVGISQNTAEIDGRRVNQREIARNANTQTSQNELDTLADEYLEEMQAVEDFDIIPLRSRSTIYGADYWWGDRITARYRGMERHKRLLGVTIRVDSNGEQFLQWKFWTIP